jgi:hypothetical protein
MIGCPEVQKPLIEPVSQELSGTEHGHTDAVTAIALTDTGLAMSGSLDCTLCVFDIYRPCETMRRIENAHEKVLTPLCGPMNLTIALQPSITLPILHASVTVMPGWKAETTL